MKSRMVNFIISILVILLVALLCLAGVALIFGDVYVDALVNKIASWFIK